MIIMFMETSRNELNYRTKLSDFTGKYEFEFIWQPDNILVDYTENEGKVTSFDFVVADWGASGHQDTHFGGTPVYASGNAFNKSSNKDIFAFGRIAAELYLPESGNINKIIPRNY